MQRRLQAHPRITRQLFIKNTDMLNSPLQKAGLLTLVITILSIAGWEMYLRASGVRVDYDDGNSLWADKRAMVYEPSDKATVFIGSSRNKYDLDIATWQALTGDHAIQLGIEGNSPLPVLDDLANDKNFKGKLVVDVTEGLFFDADQGSLAEPKGRIAYFKKRTPAERFSFRVNRVLESQFVFLDKYNYSLNGMLDHTGIPSRAGVFVPRIFPMEFGRVTFDRQDIMTDRFVADTNLQNQVRSIWYFYSQLPGDPPASGPKLDSIINTVKTDVDKIKARGGQVVFLRTPSSGPYLQGENMGFPRVKYWDRLLAVTNCPGIHFTDYPAIAHFQCPEFSHLKQADAIVFTRNLVDILHREKGWSFAREPAAQ
jgi:hypothetical protein